MVPYGPGAPRLCTRGHRSVSTCLMEYQRGDGGYQGLQAAEGLRWYSPSSGWINGTFLRPVSRGPHPGVAEEDLRGLGCRCLQVHPLPRQNGSPKLRAQAHDLKRAGAAGTGSFWGVGR